MRGRSAAATCWWWVRAIRLPLVVQLAEDGARKVWLAVRTPPHLVRRAIGPIPSDVFLELFARVPARLVTGRFHD